MPYSSPEDKRAASRRYYDAHPAVKTAAAARKARYRQRNMAFLREAKDVPCADCGERHPYYVMDFDHLRDKERELTVLAWRPVSLARLRAEIAKCDVVCSNCHRYRTHRRRAEE